MDPEDIARRARAIGDQAAAARAEPLFGAGAVLPGGEPVGLRGLAEVVRESGVVDPRRRPVGLALAGGGAKGAYQAGVVRFLAEQDVPVTAVAGASIGALNGAVVAASRDLRSAAALLRSVWWEVSGDTGPPKVGDGIVWDESTAARLRNLPGRLAGPMLRTGYLDALLAEYVDPEALRRGLPLFVTTFRAVDPTLGSISIGDYFKSQPWDGPVRGRRLRFGMLVDLARSRAGKQSDWLAVNDMPPDRMFNAILGSAGIPGFMPPRNVNGVPVRDGDILGGGNMPVGALAGRIPCERIIAVHLRDLPLFHAGMFPDVEVLEVRPSRSLEPGGLAGGPSAALDLSPRRVEALYELGYADAGTQLGRAWSEDAALQVAAALAEHRRRSVRELGEPLRPFGGNSGGNSGGASGGNSGGKGTADDPEVR